MKYADWRYLASICAFLGALLLIGGIIAYAYNEPIYLFGQIYGYIHRYRDYAVPLIIFGVVLLVVGAASYGRAEEERKLELPEPKVSLKKCPKCGIKFSEERDFCSRCGEKLEPT